MVLLTGMHNVLQNALTDMRFRWFPREPSGSIVLVAIDSPSIEKVGVWPWPRQHHADLIGKLEQAGATDIVFDVDFSSPSNPASDHALEEALKKAGGSVVLPAFKQLVTSAGEKSIHVNRPLPQFDPYAWSAIVNVAVEPDGLVRRFSFGESIDGKFLPSIGALLAGKYESREGPLRIDFAQRVAQRELHGGVDRVHRVLHALGVGDGVVHPPGPQRGDLHRDAVGGEHLGRGRRVLVVLLKQLVRRLDHERFR